MNNLKLFYCLIFSLLFSICCTPRVETSAPPPRPPNCETEEDIGSFLDYGRKRIYAPSSHDLTTIDGKITSKICVNREGKVISAEVIEKCTTIFDEETLRKAEELLLQYRFKKDHLQVDNQLQCGLYVFIIYP